MRPFRWILRFLQPQGSQRIYLYATLVGLIAGLGATIFHISLDTVSAWILGGLAGIEQIHPTGGAPLLQVEVPEGLGWRWLILILPALGGLLGGLLVYRFAPEAAGHGMDAMIDAFHNKAGVIRGIVPLIKGVATVVTLGTGGSAGKEGPVAQIGAGFGSALASWLGLGMRDRRNLLLCGTAGGLGAIFLAPLGGALTAVEVLYKEDIESEALIPCIIASVTSYVTYGSIFGFTHIFSMPEGTHFVAGELLIFMLLGVVCSGVGYLYVKIFYGIRDRIFRPLKCPFWLKPAMGGLAVGIMGFFFVEILGGGLGYVQAVISQSWDTMNWRAVGLFLALALLKIVATGFTVSSGGSGGVFGPSLFIGAMLGAAVGGAAHLIFPEAITSPLGAFVIVGMASFFAGVANAPIAAMVMISELTGGYELLAPLMLVSVISIILSKKWSIYENQVENRFHSKAHVNDMTIDVLQEIKVKDLEPYRKECITTPHLLFHAAERFGQKVHASDLVLVEKDNSLAGLVSLRDVHFDSENPLIANLITLEDIMTTRVPKLYPDTNLHKALELVMRSDFDKVPILAGPGDHNVLGYLLYSDILEKYHSTIGTRCETEVAPVS